MKKIKLNKKLFLNKDVVSNLNGVRGGDDDNKTEWPKVLPILPTLPLPGGGTAGNDTEDNTNIGPVVATIDPFMCFVGPPDPPSHRGFCARIIQTF